ncbi:MAG: LIC12231 family lipoprotein [Panacagrimonas sp.]
MLRSLCIFLTLSFATALGGCMTYGGFDKTRLDQSSPAKGPGPLRYSVGGTSLMNGHTAIREVFDHESGFDKTEQVEKQPSDGLYVKATVENVAPNVGAGVATYVSYATLFIIPAWSTNDGSRLLFDVYRDGAHQQRYEYRIQRKTFMWLPMVLFAWVNLFTTSEGEAFEAVTKQFLLDATPQLGPS